MCKPFKRKDEYDHALWAAEKEILYHITPDNKRLERVKPITKKMLNEFLDDSQRLPFVAKRDGVKLEGLYQAIHNGLYDEKNLKYSATEGSFVRKRRRKKGFTVGKYPKVEFRDKVLDELKDIREMLEAISERIQ